MQITGTSTWKTRLRLMRWNVVDDCYPFSPSLHDPVLSCLCACPLDSLFIRSAKHGLWLSELIVGHEGYCLGSGLTFEEFCDHSAFKNPLLSECNSLTISEFAEWLYTSELLLSNRFNFSSTFGTLEQCLGLGDMRTMQLRDLPKGFGAGRWQGEVEESSFILRQSPDFPLKLGALVEANTPVPQLADSVFQKYLGTWHDLNMPSSISPTRLRHSDKRLTSNKNN